MRDLIRYSFNESCTEIHICAIWVVTCLYQYMHDTPARLCLESKCFVEVGLSNTGVETPSICIGGNQRPSTDLPISQMQNFDGFRIKVCSWEQCDIGIKPKTLPNYFGLVYEKNIVSN